MMYEPEFNIFEEHITFIRKPDWKNFDDGELYIGKSRIKGIHCFWDVGFKDNSVISCILVTEDNEILLYDLKYLTSEYLGQQCIQVKQFCYDNFIKVINIHNVFNLPVNSILYDFNCCTHNLYLFDIKNTRLKTSHKIYQGYIKIHKNILNNTNIVEEMINCINKRKHYDYSGLDSITYNINELGDIL